MKTIKLFASKKHPLRMSALPTLLGCPMRVALQSVGLIEDRSGAAADTGSAMHAMAAGWHANGQVAPKAVTRAKRAAPKDFPLADLAQAEDWFNAYRADTRNIKAKILAIETPVVLTLPCALHDSTGNPVYFQGTLDQIREDEDGIRVVDLKTGRPEGVPAIEQAALQLAGYTLAAAQHLGVDRLAPPAVLRVRGYEKKGEEPSTAPVYFRSWLTWELCNDLIQQIVNTVADIRNGRIEARPGFSCSTICPARGLQNCLPKSKEIK